MGRKIVKSWMSVVSLGALAMAMVGCGPNSKNPLDASVDALPDARVKLDGHHEDRPRPEDALRDMRSSEDAKDARHDAAPADARRDAVPSEDGKRDSIPSDGPRRLDGPSNPCAGAADGTSCTAAGITGGHCCGKTCVADDVNHCGSTCQVCPSHTNATPKCDPVQGCGFTCVANTADCDPNVDGCETNTLSDKNHCGTCSTACVDTSSATLTCQSGHCALSVCSAGMADCDGNVGNSCETSILTKSNCGSCGAACPAYPNTVQTCPSERCVYACASAQYQDCDSTLHDGSDATGCETNVLGTDVNHCGSCSACPTLPSKIASCSAGTCKYACASGHADCNGPGDGSDSDGCETDLSKVGNCGACGHVCGGTNATPSCVPSGSTYACSLACTGGHLNCDGNAANGCETDGTTVSNCGACNKTCSAAGANADPACALSGSSYACGKRCHTGFADCDGLGSNGCEINLTTDIDNCGACNPNTTFSSASDSTAWCTSEKANGANFACQGWLGQQCVAAQCLSCDVAPDGVDLPTCCDANYGEGYLLDYPVCCQNIDGSASIMCGCTAATNDDLAACCSAQGGGCCSTSTGQTINCQSFHC